MHVLLREAQLQDAAAVTALSHQLGYAIDEASTLFNLQYLLQQSDGKVYVAVNDNKVIGWMHVGKRLSLETGFFYEILGIVVDQEYRGMGIGKQLVRQAIDWSRQNGAWQLRVRSNRIRTSTHLFYQQLGFETIKEQKVFALKLLTD